jgi:hypothetical protein
MAFTYPKLELKVVGANDAWLSYLKKTLPEGGSQTFKGGAPLVFSSGLLIEATSAYNPGNQKCAAISTASASGVTSAGLDVILAAPFLLMEVNLLAAAAASHTYAAADLGISTVGLAKATNLAGTGRDGWYGVSGGTAALHTISNITTFQQPGVATVGAQVGDINARVLAYFISTAIDW